MRGPGDIEGTRQSGLLNFKIANIIQDRAMLEVAKNIATQIVEIDPDLNLAENLHVKEYLQIQNGKTVWSKIS